MTLGKNLGVPAPPILTWLGEGVPTLARGIPTLAGGTYLGWGIPTLVRGVPTLARGIPTLAGGTYLGWGYLPWPGGYLPWGTPHVNRQTRCENITSHRTTYAGGKNRPEQSLYKYFAVVEIYSVVQKSISLKIFSIHINEWNSKYFEFF